MSDENEADEAPEVKEYGERSSILPIPSLETFYLSPYLTCTECNSISFVDTWLLRNALVRLEGGRPLFDSGKTEEEKEDGDDSHIESSSEPENDRDEDLGAPMSPMSQLETEALENQGNGKMWDQEFGLRLQALPRCPGCRRTHTWLVGAFDLRHRIKGDQKARRRLLRKQHKCITKVQATIRGILGRRYARKVREEKERYEAFLAFNASRISALVRGRLDRRAAQVERSLLRLKDVHSTIMQEALRPWKGVRVFWYKRKEELSLLYKDYRLLVERTGNDPPLHLVEKNINLLAWRVHLLLCRRATIIQKRVRGMIGRKFMRQYKLELSYVVAKKTAAVFIIQRGFRCWAAWKKCRILSAMKRKMEIGKRDAVAVKEKRKGKEVTLLMQKLRASYSKEVKEAKVARYLYGVPNQNTKMLLSQLTVKNGKKLIDWKGEEKEELRQEEDKLIRRDEFIHGKIKEHTVYRNYFTDELAARRATFIERLSKNRGRRQLLSPLKKV